MANIRTTVGGIGSKFPSREKGAPTGAGVNTFAMGQLKEAITGAQLMGVLLWALEPTRDQAKADWPILTGASNSTIRIESVEEGGYFARAAVIVGGQPLIDHPDNPKHIDYAPYVEFNGTIKTTPGTMTHAAVMTEAQVKDRIKMGVKAIMEGIFG